MAFFALWSVCTAHIITRRCAIYQTFGSAFQAAVGDEMTVEEFTLTRYKFGMQRHMCIFY